jgi:hypothetical protein
MTALDRTGEVLDLIEEDVLDIIATANQAGFATKEVLSALEQIVVLQRNALEEDPDPAEDPIEPVCATCQNARWICEDHKGPWPHRLESGVTCGAAGMPCPTCNSKMDQKPSFYPELPADT